MNRPPWRRLRESSAASSAPALERSSGAEEDDPDAEDDKVREDASDQVTCPTCDGSGKIQDGNKSCPDCDGTGKVSKSSLKESEVCETCGMAECDVEGTNRIREAELTTKGRDQIDKSNFAIPEKAPGSGSYPIHDSSHAKNALARSSGKPEESRVKAAVHKKYPQLKDGAEPTKESAEMAARLDKLERAWSLETKLREAQPAVLNATFSTPTRVRTAAGEEGYRVVLIREGKGNSEDDNWYTAEAVQELCESGVCEGMQAYANHPSLEEEEVRPERDVKQLVGSYHDVKFGEAEGKAQAEAIFVPLTTDETHPTYGWVVTLAEAACRNTAPQPLAGISLYGLSAGDYGKRPDMSEGRIVSMIRPTSGDIVTNAGAGGGFIRQMWESARALRRQATSRKETQPMKAEEYVQKVAEATKRLREADSDEARNAAITDLETLQGQAIDAPPKPLDTVEALTEAAPKVVEQLREAAKAEATQDVEKLQGQLREATGALSIYTDTAQVLEALREAGVEDEKELRYFVNQARARQLKEAAEIKDMVETERSYHDHKRDQMLDQLRESMDLGEVEGVFARIPAAPEGTDLADHLREAGVPVKDAA